MSESREIEASVYDEKSANQGLFVPHSLPHSDPTLLCTSGRLTSAGSSSPPESADLDAMDSGWY